MGLYEKLEHLQRHPDLAGKLAIFGAGLTASKLRGKKSVIFQCDAAGHYPYLEPYRKKIEARGDLDLYWTGSAEGDDVFAFLRAQGIPQKKIIHDIALVRLLPFDVYVSPTSWGNVFPKAPTCEKVQIFHTLADKNIQYGDNLLKFDVLFLPGPFHGELLERYVFSKHPRARSEIQTYEVGFAKIDSLVENEHDIDSIKAGLGIDPASPKPIVVYAPNWEKTSALHRYGRFAIDALSKMDVEVIVKLHYMSLFPPENERATGGVDWNAMLAELEGRPNVHVVRDQSIDPYFALADVLVTDYGGAALEFISTLRPAVYLDCPDFFAERGADIIDYWSRDTGYVVDSVQEMTRAVRLALTEDDGKKELREKLRSRLIFNPGRAAQVGTDIIATQLGRLDKNRIARAIMDALPRGQ